MFRAADLVLLNKIDLLPYVIFDVADFLDGARRANEPTQDGCLGISTHSAR